MRMLSLAVATMAAVMPLAVSAQQREVARPVADRPTVTLDPTKGYLLVNAQFAVSLTLIREPTPAEIEQWNADRAEALADAQRRYTRQVRRYEDDMRLYRSARSSGNRSMREPVRPVEPTDASFQFSPIELRQMYSFGPQNRFAKSGGSALVVSGNSTYLTQLPPGTYHIYGPVSVLPNGGAMGYCLCMGTVSFEVAPGQITNLGEVINPLARRAATFGEQPVPPQMDPDSSVSGFGLEPATESSSVDPRLSSFTVVPARLRPGRRFANWYGLAVDRISPIAGVFTYRRDQMVDLVPPPAAPAPESDVVSPSADVAAPSTPTPTVPAAS
jgi:hypothetical protein